MAPALEEVRAKPDPLESTHRDHRGLSRVALRDQLAVELRITSARSRSCVHRRAASGGQAKMKARSAWAAGSGSAPLRCDLECGGRRRRRQAALPSRARLAGYEEPSSGRSSTAGGLRPYPRPAVPAGPPPRSHPVKLSTDGNTSVASFTACISPSRPVTVVPPKARPRPAANDRPHGT
jgi:hypothetical protein